jgi:primosomal protein N' (replication factor Y)
MILEVAVPSPLHSSFDYLPPESENTATPSPGIRILVPFGHRKVVGILLSVRDYSAIAPRRLKPAIELIDTEPLLDPALIAFLQRAARYYHHPVGEVFAAALPTLLRGTGKLFDSGIQIWKLTGAGRDVQATVLARAPRQMEVIKRLAGSNGLPREQLPVPYSVLRTLEKKGWIACQHQPQVGHHVSDADLETPHTPGNAQQQAVTAIHASFGQFETFLLEGVTGSGKTEVYLQLITTLLKDGCQVLVLVPEIGLTPQLVNRFARRCATPLAVLHSGLSDRQRLTAWQQAASGRAGIILGTRSAIFTPLHRAGLIIIDEEHDTSFKQQEGFRYSARDLAVWRGQQLGVPVILGSATPSLKSLYNARKRRYHHLQLPERAGNAQTPAMRLIDLRGQPMYDLLSMSMLQAIKAHLQSAGQVLLFLNRRGFAPVLLCHDCGWVANCQRCDARLILHRSKGVLRCHHCDSQRPVDTVCPACGSSKLITVGEGTEKVGQALQHQFPDQTVLRVDRDTTRRKGQLEDALDSARKGDARILLGTQMLAKGHHFPNVTLVAILDADQGLLSTDFRASERMAQMIIQVAGRAGRADKPGEVLVQTHNPDHPLLQKLIEHGYPAFADSALREREETGLPPWSSLALLRAEAAHADHPRAFLEAARKMANSCGVEGILLLGPVAAPMERRAGRYRAQLMVQATRRSELQQLLTCWIPGLEKEKTARRVRWSIDVDPVDLF